MEKNVRVHVVGRSGGCVLMVVVYANKLVRHRDEKKFTQGNERATTH